ncbi:hypothetical protein EV2_036344 [Malus domestica]
MESLSMILSFSPPPQNHVQTQKTTPLTTHLSSPNHHHSRHFHFPATQYFPHAISLHQKHSSCPNFPSQTHSFPPQITKTQLTFLLAELIATICIHSPFIGFRIRSLRTGASFRQNKP